MLAHLKRSNRRVSISEHTGHLCRFCHRSFSRSYNRDRHEKQGCQKRPEQEEMTSQSATGNSPAASFLEGQTDEEYRNYQSQLDDEEQEEHAKNDDDIIDDESENEDEDNESVTTEDENDDTDPLG